MQSVFHYKIVYVLEVRGNHFERGYSFRLTYTTEYKHLSICPILLVNMSINLDY